MDQQVKHLSLFPEIRSVIKVCSMHAHVPPPAVGGEDYEELSERDVLLTFDDTTRSLSFNVTIFEDGFIESLESFDLQLSFDPELNVVPSGVVLNPDKSTITITDEDSMLLHYFLSSLIQFFLFFYFRNNNWI